MSLRGTIALAPRDATFRHEAFFYAGEEEFVAGATAFVRHALAAEEPVLVAVNAPKIALLRESLNGDADEVRFADMSGFGRNPARIIPVWREFVDEYEGRRVSGIGEPIGPDRSPEEMVECQRHESLLNLAFADAAPLWLLCPYDTAGLEPSVIEEARRSHPFLADCANHRRSKVYRGLADCAAPFDVPLPDPGTRPSQLTFRTGPLSEVRGWVSRQASRADLAPARASDLVLAVHEIAANSVRYGGGEATLRTWFEGGTLIFEIEDRGHIHDPLAGRRRPGMDEGSGRGLWLANQLCDLVQVRSFTTGTVVRLHMRGF